MRVLLIDCDTLRPDHLGCYGYDRNTSPNIDKVAKTGICFNEYYCSDAPCLPSRAALFTGKFGIHTGIVGHGGTTADMRSQGPERGMQDWCKFNNLPNIFRKKGIYTASISSFSERHSAWWFNAGFNEVQNIGNIGFETSEEVNVLAKQWLKRNVDNENWFLHVHYWDAHTPIRTPEELGNPFENMSSESIEWMNEELLIKHKMQSGAHSASEICGYSDNGFPGTKQMGHIEDMQDFKQNIDNYDTAIYWMDRQIGELLDICKSQKIYEDMAIIITADHGENYGELGIYDEHGTADYCTTRIPLIIKWPGGLKGTYSDAKLYNVDLLPTLAELIKDEPIISSQFRIKLEGDVTKGYEGPKPNYDGISFADIVKNRDCDFSGRPYLVVSTATFTCQRAVRFDDYMYIRTYHDAYHLFPDEMLFNIKEDPHETIDLSEKERNLCYRAAWLLEQWHTENMKSQIDYAYDDPIWRMMHEGEPFHIRGNMKNYQKRLQLTDRTAALNELKIKHPKIFGK